VTGARAVPPRTVPTELAALALGVSQATVRKWASRGKLTRHGRPGRAEYDVEELFALSQARTAAAGRVRDSRSPAADPVPRRRRAPRDLREPPGPRPGARSGSVEGS